MNTSEGAKKGVKTMRKKYGKQWFRERARKAGQASRGGGFNDPELAKKAGAKGGKQRWAGSNGGGIS